MPLLSETPRPGRTDAATVAQLSAMMFLQFWPLGLWAVTVNTFIAANTESGGERLFSAGFLGYSASASAIGGLVAPALFGWIADRHFSAEKCLALLHLAAAGAVAWMVVAPSQWAFYAAMLLYFQAYAPSVTLASTIALGRLADPDREFPAIRLFGTVAWIAAGVTLGVLLPRALGVESIDASRLPFRIAAWSHAVMAVFSLTLPRTIPCPPAPGARGGVWSLLGDRAVLGFLAVSLLVAMTTQPYPLAMVFLSRGGFEAAATTLTLGQLTEVACMGGMPWLRRRVSLKTLLLLGTLAWGVRYALLAMGSLGGPETPSALLVLVAVALHGPAYVFVYLAGQLYIDRLAPASGRGLGQGLHLIATGGIGHLVGSVATGWAQARYLTPAGVDPPPYDWFWFWLLPVGPSVLAAFIFWRCFSERPHPAIADGGAQATSLRSSRR